MDRTLNLTGNLFGTANSTPQTAQPFFVPIQQAVSNYFAPTQNVRARDFVRELPQATASTLVDTAKSLAAAPIRVGASLVDLPNQLRGKEPAQPFFVPILGQQQTYARQFLNRSQQVGQLPAALEAGGQGILDAVMTGQAAEGAYNLGKKAVNQYQAMSPLEKKFGGVNKQPDFENQRDAVAKALSENRDMFNRMGMKNKDILPTAEADSILAKIEAGKDTPEDIRNGMELLKLHGIDINKPGEVNIPIQRFTKGAGGRFTGSTSEVPKELQPLAQEAKTYYHVTSSESAKSIEQNGFKPQIGERSLGVANAKGTWLYEDKSATTEFGKNFKNPATVETQVNGKVFDAMNNDKSIRALVEDKKLIADLKGKGYVGIKGDEMGTPATFIFDPKALQVKSPLSSLAAEAKKYKSAEEFVKAQGQKVFHGTEASNIINKEGFKLMPGRGVSAYGDGVYLSTKAGDAKGYGGVVEAYLPKDIKLFEAKSSEPYTVNTKKLISEGYDGVKVKQPNGAENLVIFDPSKIKTKSQLTDFYNKVKGKK